MFSSFANLTILQTTGIKVGLVTMCVKTKQVYLFRLQLRCMWSFQELIWAATNSTPPQLGMKERGTSLKTWAKLDCDTRTPSQNEQLQNTTYKVLNRHIFHILLDTTLKLRQYFKIKLYFKRTQFTSTNYFREHWMRCTAQQEESSSNMQNIIQ